LTALAPLTLQEDLRSLQEDLRSLQGIFDRYVGLHMQGERRVSQLHKSKRCNELRT